jgi:hypothetical protein
LRARVSVRQLLSGLANLYETGVRYRP